VDKKTEEAKTEEKKCVENQLDGMQKNATAFFKGSVDAGMQMYTSVWDGMYDFMKRQDHSRQEDRFFQDSPKNAVGALAKTAKEASKAPQKLFEELASVDA